MCGMLLDALADQVRVFQAHRFSSMVAILNVFGGYRYRSAKAFLRSFALSKARRDWVFVFLERPNSLIHVNGPARFYPIELASVSEPRSEHIFCSWSGNRCGPDAFPT